jgi:uncharacterized DUF497 family protein
MNENNPSFEWDDAKNRSNYEKHGVEFSIVQKAFLDPYRIIAEDDAHSAIEKRYFCIGLVESEILSVRLHGAKVAFAFLEPDFGEKENRFMKNKIEYTKGEIGKVKIIKDFLPPPSELVLRDDNVKVTLSLSRRSIDFFKGEAKKQRVPYQKMIRALVDGYAERVGK